MTHCFHNYCTQCTDSVDRTLSSLDELMSLFISNGDKAQVGVLAERFIQNNKSEESVSGGSDVLYEVCNISYALKVIIR